MRIFLRILVVLLLLLSAGSLAIGVKLFNQREVLKARIQRMEEHVKATAQTIEAVDAEVGEQPPLTSLDGMDDYGEEDYDFWNKYLEAGGAGIEATDGVKFRVDPDHLKTLYRRDPIEPTKPFKDAEGRKIMQGAGTMDQLLDDLQEKTRTQLDRLNDTRYWLTQMRSELDTTINRHNKVMAQRNERRAEVADLKEERTKLQGDLRNTESSLAEAREQIDSLETEIRDKDEAYANLEAEYQDLQVDMEALDKRFKDLEAECGKGDIDDPALLTIGTATRGQKGRIAYHDSENHFVIINVPAETDLQAGVELTCVRKGADDNASPTGKIRFRELFEDSGKAVADVLNDWEIRKDDRVIF